MPHKPKRNRAKYMRAYRAHLKRLDVAVKDRTEQREKEWAKLLSDPNVTPEQKLERLEKWKKQDTLWVQELMTSSLNQKHREEGN